MSSTSFDDQTKIPWYIVFISGSGLFILCVRTLKSGNYKQNEWTENFLRKQWSLSAKAPIGFRRRSSHVKSFCLGKTTWIKRAKLWSRIWKLLVSNCEQMLKMKFFVIWSGNSAKQLVYTLQPKSQLSTFCGTKFFDTEETFLPASAHWNSQNAIASGVIYNFL